MSEVESKLGVKFQKPQLLEQALTHKSYFFETKSASGHNEKLEFLGDAVLDLVLSELLMELFPTDTEGDLSKKRASLVNEGVLSKIAKGDELQKYLRLGKGEQQSGGDQKPRLLASALEALIGAMFLDSGFEKVRDMVREQFRDLIQELSLLEDFSADYKTRLQEEVQGRLKEAPLYVLTAETGPAHDRTFEVVVKIKSKSVARAFGKSKKTAEQEAARLALDVWKSSKGQLT